MVRNLPGVTEYTTEILDKNFILLDSFMTEVADTIWAQSEALMRVDKTLQHVSEVAHRAEKAAKVVVKVHKRSKIVTIGLVGGAFYVGYKFATATISDERAAKIQKVTDKMMDKTVDKAEDLLLGKKDAKTSPVDKTEKD